MYRNIPRMKPKTSHAQGRQKFLPKGVNCHVALSPHDFTPLETSKTLGDSPVPLVWLQPLRRLLFLR